MSKDGTVVAWVRAGSALLGMVLALSSCGRADDGAPSSRGSAPGRGPTPGPGQVTQAPDSSQQAPPSAPANFQGGPPPQQVAQAGDAALDQLMQWERQDMGVAPTRQLHSGGMHGPTPSQLPGGQVITTKGLVPLLQGAQGAQALVFDVLGGPQQLPNAIPAAAASQPGSFNDATQQQFGQMLQQVTRGRNDVPLVFYCQGPQCWMSYNAALRAINLGYRNVLWYRGGIEAWQRAGLPLIGTQSPSTQGGPPPGGQPYGGAPPQGGGYPGGQPYGGAPPQGGGYPGGQPYGGVPPQGGPYPGGQPYGGPPPQGGPYPSGQPYGGAPPQGGPYPGGQPYGGGPQGGSPGQQGGYPPR